MKNSRFSLAVWCLLLGLVSTVSAEERWRLANLNPFGKRESDRATARVGDQPQERLSLPKPALPKFSLWPKRSAAPARKSSPPSALTKLNRSTKRVWAKTKKAVTPWNWSKDKSQPSGGAPPLRTARARGASSKKKPFYSSLLPQKQEPPRIETVNDWLAQPRPSP